MVAGLPFRRRPARSVPHATRFMRRVRGVAAHEERSVPGPRSRKPASRRSTSRRSSSTRRPQPSQTRPMSAPSRTTRHVVAPQGCRFRSRRRSPRTNATTGRSDTVRSMLRRIGHVPGHDPRRGYCAVLQRSGQKPTFAAHSIDRGEGLHVALRETQVRFGSHRERVRQHARPELASPRGAVIERDDCRAHSAN
jgi:hypothetical protein